jgi:thiamine-monophosphate kinase
MIEKCLVEEDIAAMGAKPFGLLTSYILPNETPIKDFKRMLEGVDDACKQSETLVLGGNIKESKFISCEACAIGYGNPQKLIRRKGASVGDIVVVVGDLGLFWAGVLKVKNKIPLVKSDEKKILSNVLTPRAKLKEGLIISRYGLLSSGLDNSDGIYPSVNELASQNNVDIILDYSEVIWDPLVLKVAKWLKVDPIRLGLGWGDWQIVGTVPENKLEILKNKMSKLNTGVHTIGKVISGTGKIRIIYEGQYGIMNPIESERFSKNSWFTQGIDSYINELLNVPLLKK